jgi:DUF1680 family protein
MVGVLRFGTIHRHCSLQRESRLDRVSKVFTRRDFLAGAAATAWVGGLSRPAFAAAPSNGRLLEEFDYNAVHLTGGPLKEQYDRIHADYLALDNDRLLKPYRERAGLPAPGENVGGWYDGDGFVPGHSLGQYISGLARLGRTTGDAACHAKAGALVEGFAATLGSKDQVFAGANAEKVWPCYILDKHLAGLVDAYRLSGVEAARELLPRVFHGALPYIPERGRDRVGKKDPPYDETFVLPETLFAVHELTGDRVFLDRAKAYLLDRDFFDPLARGEDVLPGRHAYSHAIALSSAGKAHLVLGDEKYLRAMQHAWEFLTTTQQYASGGWGPNETFIEPHEGQLYASLSSTADHFETPCGSYAAMKLSRYLLCATAEGRYGDNLERVLYNTILAVKEPDGKGNYPYYSTYSPGARKTYYPVKCPCCSGTLVEGVADYVKNIYFRAADGVAVNLYVPSQVQWNQDDAAMTLTQQTEYPLAERVTLRIDASAPREFALSLRMPGWLQGTPMLHVNGHGVHTETSRGFAVLRRRWHAGDTVSFDLPLSFRTEPIDDLHPQTVAALRGPLLYVELNPVEGNARLGALEGRQPAPGVPGLFREHVAGRERLHLPFYAVRDESYTTYFENS